MIFIFSIQPEMIFPEEWEWDYRGGTFIRAGISSPMPPPRGKRNRDFD